MDSDAGRARGECADEAETAAEDSDFPTLFSMEERRRGMAMQWQRARGRRPRSWSVIASPHKDPSRVSRDLTKHWAERRGPVSAAEPKADAYQ